MSFLRRLFGADHRTPPPVVRHVAAAQVLEGPHDLEVVGESHYQEAIVRVLGLRNPPTAPIRVDISAMLVAEVDNPYDANAISVWINGQKVGHLSRADARRYRAGLQMLERSVGGPIALRGVIAGGGPRDDDERSLLGVFLRHDRAHFGLRPPARGRPRQQGEMRTGLSEALATDDEDDSYDLSWIDDLPRDPVKAIHALRALLEQENDPIDRHFMFHHLEETLYRSRDVFRSALDEFDECCRQHDQEMERIRDAFIAKWKQVPWLMTYKQMCIRLAKAKRFEEALWWAERGLAVYGTSGNAAAVEDLRKRAESYRPRL